MRFVWLWLVMGATLLFGAVAEERAWPKGTTFLTFLEENKIPLSLYYSLPGEDKELAAEIYSGVRFHVLKDEESGEFLQALIPITEDSQIHVYKEKGEGNYGMAIIPISYFEKSQSVVLSMNASPYQDILEATGDYSLAGEFVSAYKNSLDFRRSIQRDDKLAVLYDRKYRLGKPFGSPSIKASMVETRGKPNFIFLFKDGRYYDDTGREMASFLLTTPLNYSRISSRFSSGRKHPILGIVRPHLGVDYAAPKGTPIKAAGDGRVVFAGTKGGYGTTLIVAHADGYKTLYAHLNGIAKGIRTGVSVKQGSLIGFVGSSGLSSGPHLHLGLYKNDKAIDPLKSLKITKSALAGKERQEFMQLAQSYKSSLQEVVAQGVFPALGNAPEFLVKSELKPSSLRVE